MKAKCESGIALITVLLILVLMGALLQGFILSVNSDQQLISTDRKHNQAFYGALAGLEQMTADLGNLFYTNFRPTTAQITALAANPPAVAHISFILPGGGDGYQITPESEEIRNIPTGPYEGMVGLVRPYTMTVTARAFDSGEVQLQRRLQTVAIPVFQFGFFSESDLSFYSGTDFDFGGRVHTNGNLFLSGSWTSHTDHERPGHRGGRGHSEMAAQRLLYEQRWRTQPDHTDCHLTGSFQEPCR